MSTSGRTTVSLPRAERFVEDRLLDEATLDLIGDLVDRFGTRRIELLNEREARRHALVVNVNTPAAEEVTVHSANWTIDPVPASLRERRVELLGGTRRKDLVEGFNSGAMSYVADLWNLTGGEASNVLRAHHNLVSAAHMRLSCIIPGEGRVRIHPGSTTRLFIAPRPLHLTDDTVLVNDAPVPALFLDLALLATHSARALAERQRCVLFYLRGVHGHGEARLIDDVFRALEERLEQARGTFRATVMVDSVNAALELDAILHAFRHHSAGLSLDPQAYAADHITLFSKADGAPLPDRESIGLNAPFLRNLSLLVIGTSHRRGTHAIGAPAFALPNDLLGRFQAGYLAMLADKEREAVDGHDGTLVGHPGLVTAAIAEFNKSMPMADQIGFQRKDLITPEDLVRRPEGTITVESLVGMLRTTLRALSMRQLDEPVVIQGGRIHDRSSVQLALSLLWQWVHSDQGVVSATGLRIHGDLFRYLVKKEAEKLFTGAAPDLRDAGLKATEQLLGLVLGDRVPQWDHC